MLLENLVNKQGTLAEILPLFDISTIQPADEITNARKTDEDLRSKWFWTADSALYTIEDGEAILYLGRNAENNPIFKNIEKASKPLPRTGIYIPSKEDIESVIDAKDTLRINLSDLELQEDSGEYSCFEIDTLDNKARKLNKTQRQFAKRVYGTGKAYEASMKMLEKAGINNSYVYALTPNHVKNNTKQGSAISRACWLYDFGFVSYFFAIDWGIVGPILSLRGVLKRPEADAAQKSEEFTLKQAYHKILDNPVPDEDTAKKLIKHVADSYK